MPVYSPSPSEMSSFVMGMEKMFEFAQKVKPDVLVFPLRGSFPFYISFETISRLEGIEMPDSVLLPIGTNIHSKTREVSGITKPKKMKIVEEQLGKFFETHSQAKRALLIDEVMMGGTILTHSKMIRRVFQQQFSLRELELKVCAIEGRIGANQRTGRYRGAAARYEFCQVEVENLFTVDRDQYLPTIERSGDEFCICMENYDSLQQIMIEIGATHKRVNDSIHSGEIVRMEAAGLRG